jgi:DNA-directed RNA polymerase specialized sigma24 family protein
MSNEDDGVPWLPSAKGPTAQELKALAAEAAWLNESIDWEKLCHYASSFTLDQTIGDEIVKQLYHDMLQWPPEKLRALRKPQAYAKTALKNRLLNWVSRYARPDRITSLPENYENIADDSPSLEAVLDTRRQVVNFLAELPPEWLEPFILTKVYGFTAEETAKELNLTLDAVKKRVVKAFHYCEARPPDTLLSPVQKITRRKGQHHDE